MMEILHINSNYLTSRLHENLIDRTESSVLHNTIFMPIKEETKDAFLYKSKHEVYSPVTFKDIDKFIFTYKQRKIYDKLLETVNPEKFDLVQAHTLFTDGNIAYELYKKYNIPYIVTVRGYTDIDSFFKIRFNLRSRGRQILEHASKVIFLSESNRQELLNGYIHDATLKSNIMNKSIILPNGIDDFWFENEYKPKTVQKTEPLNIIYVGKTMKLKNLLGTVKALNTLKNKKGIESKYTFIGATLEEAYAKDLKKEINVEYADIPAIPREELIKYYRNNDIFVMPSFSETFGLVYPEAMSQGLPVIYTKNQGFDGQFEEGSVGYSVDSSNPQDIAEKILMVVENYETLSVNSLEGYKKFDWDHLSQLYIDIYKDITSN